MTGQGQLAVPPYHALPGGGGGASEPWVFNVKSYGAKGDNTTDDTAAINAAVTAAVNYALGGSVPTYFAQVYFPPGVYVVSSATTQGGAAKANAQIPLGPVIPTTGQKLVLEIVGAPLDNSALYHWEQTTVQKAGATIRSTLVGSNDGTYGEASVLGGPTPAQGYGAGGSNSTFSNSLIVVRGLQVIVPNDPHVCGLDLRGVAEMNVDNFACKVNASPTTAITGPTQTWQFGLSTPSNNNNDLSRIGTATFEGMNYGVIVSEHTVAERIVAIACVAGVEVGYGGDTAHGSRINYYSAEGCNVGLGCVLGGGPATKVDIGLLDWEGASWNGGTFAVITDPGGSLVGDIRLTQISLAHFVWDPNGGSNSCIRVTSGSVQARIYDMTRLSGAVSGPDTPAVPASNTALFNPFFRDAMVCITGGTVSSLKVDGQTLGITSGPILVPSCKTVAWVGTGAPTWTWTLL